MRTVLIPVRPWSMAQSSKATRASSARPTHTPDAAFVGEACNHDQPCKDGLACLSIYSDGEGAYPEGICSSICPKHSCPEAPQGQTARCVQWSHETEPVCLLDCGATRRCEREGYTCARIQRSDSSRMRHVCVPRAEAAADALQNWTKNDTPIPPKGTAMLDAARIQWKGSPITFATANQWAQEAAADDPDAMPVNEHDAAEDAHDASDTTADSDAESSGDTTPAPREESTEDSPASSDVNANKDQGDVQDSTSAHEGQENSPTPSARRDDGLSKVSMVIIAVVGIITLFTLLRMIFSGSFGGLLRSVRDAADDETPLERLRRLERKKRVHGPRPDQAPDIRLERRRSPVRPLRSIPNTPDEHDADDLPVLSRDEAIARAKIADTPAPKESKDDNAEPSVDAEDAAKQPTPPPSKAGAMGTETSPKKKNDTPPAPPIYSADDLRTFSTLRGASKTSADAAAPATVLGVERSPERPAPQSAPPVQLWARANAARTFRANRVSPPTDEKTKAKDMDEFVAPLPIDIVLQLLDALLDYAENVRQRKGYKEIVYIETDPRKTVFQRGPEGEIRIQHAADALAKPILAVDAMRRKGFSPALKVPDAHLLSLVHLGRYLLGSAAPDDVITDIDALSAATGRFSDEELRLMRYLLAPEEHAHLQHLAMSRGRTGGFAGAQNIPAPTAPSQASVDWLPCPDCASEVHVGDLACGQCGTALHPRPAFCSACGSLNLLFADGRPQACANLSCDQDLLVPPSAADAESRRLSIVASLLSSFEEFRKLPAPGNVEHYEAYSQGRRVEIWQLPHDRGTLLLEDDRPHYGLSDVFTLPHRSIEESGVRFVVYDPPQRPKNPLHQLGPSKLAEGLLLLWEEIHRAKLRAPTLTIEDLSVSDAGDVMLLHGHVLRAETAATPRIQDTRFMAPELVRQAIATERSDLYTLAAIWKYALSGQLPAKDGDALEGDAFIGASDLVLELMAQCLRVDAADRPTSVRYMLTQLRRRRRLSDLV